MFIHVFSFTISKETLLTIIKETFKQFWVPTGVRILAGQEQRHSKRNKFLQNTIQLKC